MADEDESVPKEEAAADRQNPQGAIEASRHKNEPPDDSRGKGEALPPRKRPSPPDPSVWRRCPKVSAVTRWRRIKDESECRSPRPISIPPGAEKVPHKDTSLQEGRFKTARGNHGQSEDATAK
mmetsp:Transcript_4740/g.9164  ORF Transcript_4740/g.9164 Transcript_4740/m.9164 type:complete len:123 (+) Transcript_4740:3404-3772(+)